MKKKNEIHESDERIIKGFEKSEVEAAEIIKSKEQTEEKLKEVIDKLGRINDGPIKQVIDDILLIVDLIKSYIKGEYNDIPMTSIISLLAALIYFLSPIDVIPDFILGIGLIDDVFVLALVMKSVHADLMAYKNWRTEKSSDKK